MKDRPVIPEVSGAFLYFLFSQPFPGLQHYWFIDDLFGRTGEVYFWYVAVDGDDDNSCLSPAQPCATINAAVDKASDFDRIEVGPGTYDYVEAFNADGAVKSDNVQDQGCIF